MTCPGARDTPSKGGLIPDTFLGRKTGEERWRKLPLLEGLAAYQLVGGVTAHQGYDG